MDWQSILDPKETLDLGDGHRLSPILGKQDELIGYMDEHPHATEPGRECWGSVALEGTEWGREHPRWRVVQAQPLTLAPSLLCPTCGNHGFVRDGRWVPA